MGIKEKSKYIFFLPLLGMFLGGCTGVITWIFLRLLSFGQNALWESFPEFIGAYNGGSRLIFTVIVCTIGGVIIGFWQNKHGVYPETLEKVLGRVKKEGKYPYNNVGMLLVSSFIPLIFGGCLGPEAGLSSVIVALSSFIGIKLKYTSEEMKELAQAGFAATLGVVFNAPFYGLVNDIESEIDYSNIDENKRIFNSKERKLLKVLVIALSTAAGVLSIAVLSKLFGFGTGIEKFKLVNNPTLDDWKWFVVLLIVGVLGGFIYKVSENYLLKISGMLPKNRIYTTIIGGLALGLICGLVPEVMFSGEHKMGLLMEGWTEYTAIALFGLGIIKLVLTTICLSFGWRGGNIFPIIFGGSALGYGVVAIANINPVFGVAVSVASVCGYIMKKPVTVVAVLFLCFPIRIFIPLGLAAIISSFIGNKVKIFNENKFTVV